MFEARKKKTGAEVQRPIELFDIMDGKSTMSRLVSKAAAFAEGSVPAKYKALGWLAAFLHVIGDALSSIGVIVLEIKF